MKYLLETKWHVIDTVTGSIQSKRRHVKYKRDPVDAEDRKDRRYARQRRRAKRR